MTFLAGKPCMTKSEEVERLLETLRDHAFLLPTRRAHTLILEGARRILADRPPTSDQALASLTALQQHISMLAEEHRDIPMTQELSDLFDDVVEFIRSGKLDTDAVSPRLEPTWHARQAERALFSTPYVRAYPTTRD